MSIARYADTRRKPSNPRPSAGTRERRIMPTNIEWCQETWNPITGCTKISEGCRNCYAGRMAKRLAGRYGYPADEPFTPGNWRGSRINKKTGDMIISNPRYWKKPRKVFVCSMGDFFHETVTREMKDAVYRVVCSHPRHTFLFLTKRPENVMSWWLGNVPNVWLGVTAENQEQADKRIPILLSIPAAIRFVSIEPMLGPVHINYSKMFPTDVCFQKPPLLDWVIVGGESGPGARPMHPDWVRQVRDDCVNAGVPFFFKQWGGWAPVEYYDRDYYLISEGKHGTPLKPMIMAKRLFNGVDNGSSVFPVGKKRAGRMIDGRTWDGYPDPPKGE